MGVLEKEAGWRSPSFFLLLHLHITGHLQDSWTPTQTPVTFACQHFRLRQQATVSCWVAWFASEAGKRKRSGDLPQRGLRGPSGPRESSFFTGCWRRSRQHPVKKSLFWRGHAPPNHPRERLPGKPCYPTTMWCLEVKVLTPLLCVCRAHLQNRKQKEDVRGCPRYKSYAAY